MMEPKSYLLQYQSFDQNKPRDSNMSEEDQVIPALDIVRTLQQLTDRIEKHWTWLKLELKLQQHKQAPDNLNTVWVPVTR